MSDISTAADTGLGGSDALGNEQAADTTVSAPTAPAFDWSPYADQEIEIQVGGKPQRIPLKAAIEGSMRQADYTAKTQELAQTRQQLEYAETIARALEADPERTIEYLADLYLSEETGQDEVDWESLSPEEQRLLLVEQGLAEQQEFQTQLEITREIEGLQARYGEKFDPQAVLRYAVEHENPDLEAAFKAMAYDELVASQPTDDQRQAVDALRQEAARAASVVSGGRAPATGSVVNTPPDGRMTVREALELSMREHGVSDLSRLR